MRKQIAALLALLALLVAPPLAAAATASLPDIEDEVMCPTCGVPLNQAFSPQAERERSFIRAEIAKGRSKQEIKDMLVSEFGPRVLATPQTDDSAFNWAAYLIPVAAIGAAGVAIFFALRRWRRQPVADHGADDASENGAAPISPADAARLEQDLSRYDV